MRRREVKKLLEPQFKRWRESAAWHRNRWRGRESGQRMKETFSRGRENRLE